jgi:hypothetical protein
MGYGSRPRGPSFARIFGTASVAVAVAIIVMVLSAPSAGAATRPQPSAPDKWGELRAKIPPSCAEEMDDPSLTPRVVQQTSKRR